MYSEEYRHREPGLEQNSFKHKKKKRRYRENSEENEFYKQNKRFRNNSIKSEIIMYNKIDQGIDKLLNKTTNSEGISEKQDLNSSKPNDLFQKHDNNSSYTNHIKIKKELSNSNIIKYKALKTHKKKHRECDNDSSETSTPIKKKKKKKSHHKKSEEPDCDSFEGKDKSYVNVTPKDNKLSTSASIIHHKSHKETSKLNLYDDYDSKTHTPIKKKKKSHKRDRTPTELEQLFSDSPESRQHSKGTFSENERYNSLANTPVKKKKKSHSYNETSSQCINNTDIEDKGKSIKERHSYDAGKTNKPSKDKQSTLESFITVNKMKEFDNINANRKNSYVNNIKSECIDSSQISKTRKNQDQCNDNDKKMHDNCSKFELVKKKKKKHSRTDSESSAKTENNKSHSKSDIEKDKCVKSPKESKENKEHRTSGNGLIKKEPHDEDFICGYESVLNMLELADETRFTDEHKEMLKNLVIEIPWAIPESHLIETRMSTHPSKSQQAKFKEIGFQMKTDHYTVEEDSKILDNWQHFLKLHNLPNDPQPFLAFEAFRNSKIKGSILPKAERINFVRFLGHGLPHRCLFSVYRRFKKLFDVNKKGKFSPEEDSIILNYVGNSHENNKFAQLAFFLGRDRHAILLRHKLLTKKCMNIEKSTSKKLD